MKEHVLFCTDHTTQSPTFIPERCAKFFEGKQLHALSRRQPDAIKFFTGDLANIEANYHVIRPNQNVCGRSRQPSTIYSWLASVVILVLSVLVIY
jgi:hypothetical protein